MNRKIQPTLVIFSGLPGTGKSTLADRVARELRWPLLRIDDVAGMVPRDADYRFWDEKVLILLDIVEAQLELGVSVIADSIFMGTDRLHAQEIASKQAAQFRPVYCYVSDEALWEKRVTGRFDTHQGPDVASWEQVQHQRQWFAHWQAGTGLFVDAVEPVDENFAKVLEYITSLSVSLEPLQVKVPLVKGRYHQ